MHIIWKILKIWRYKKKVLGLYFNEIASKVLEYKLDKKICVFSLENKMDHGEANSFCTVEPKKRSVCNGINRLG